MRTLLGEVRMLASRIGSLRSILLHVVLFAAFGVWIPRLKGLDFLDSQVLGAYACLGIIFAGPATAQAFTEGVSSSFQQAIGRIFAGVLYGEVVAAALIGMGIETVYMLNKGRYVPEPEWETLGRCAVFGLGAALMLASLAAFVAVRFSRRMALICLRLAFFGLLVLYYYRGQRLGDFGLAAGVACLLAAGVEIALLRRACR